MRRTDFNNIYNTIKESAIDSRLIKHSTIKQLVSGLDSKFKVEILGKSVLDKEIYSIEFGIGSKNIFLWSQMHGNEPTATGAIFDILNYFDKYFDSELVSALYSKYKFTFIPMLNPDGAAAWTRVNALNIDLNRDAVAKQASESKILWDMITKLNPEYSFNLHDQRNIFNVGNTDKTATISFLSASFDKSRAMNEDRALTMSLIASMNDAIQKLIPGHVGRYTDEFYPTATGDNLHKLGYKNILIESGIYPNDAERQITRKANFIVLSTAFELVSHGFSSDRIDDYNNIPNNGKKFYDLIIRSVKLTTGHTESIVDLGIMYNERPNKEYSKMNKHSRVENIGDLSQYIGLIEIDALNNTFFDGEKNYAFLNQEATFKIGEIIELNNGVVV